MSDHPLISVVSPVYRAEDCIGELCERLRRTLGEISEDFEIILIEDGSPDGSWNKIQQEARIDNRVTGIRLTKNFGQHRAITAGIDAARGEWVVVMDCDLQDPPEAIRALYAKAAGGHEVVVARFEERKESKLRQKFSKIFWSMLSWFAGLNFDYQVGNFRIMSRRVVDQHKKYREQVRLLGGINGLMGFPQISVPVQRDVRFAGETSYSFRKLFSAAVQTTVAYSDKPLRVSVYFGFFVAALSLFTGLLILVLGLRGLVEVPGWVSVMVSLYFVGGLIIANLGVLGYYIGKVFDETKRRPLYVVAETTIGRPISRKVAGNELAGRVLWITGLSGAGKSTLAREVATLLRAQGESVFLLDGDEIREALDADAGTGKNHLRKTRLVLARRYSSLSRVISAQGLTVVVATISLFREVHEWNRKNIPNYFEVYLKVPVEELRKRDPKKIYKKFESGEITNVAGLDLKIDEPVSPDLVFEFEQGKPASVLARILVERAKIA